MASSTILLDHVPEPRVGLQSPQRAVTHVWDGISSSDTPGGVKRTKPVALVDIQQRSGASKRNPQRCKPACRSFGTGVIIIHSVPTLTTPLRSAKQPPGNRRRHRPRLLTHWVKRTPHAISAQGSADPEAVGYRRYPGWCQQPLRGWLS